MTKGNVREVRLTVRLTVEDRERLERVRVLLSPHVEISQGKVISASLELVEQLLLSQK